MDNNYGISFVEGSNFIYLLNIAIISPNFRNLKSKMMKINTSSLVFLVLMAVFSSAPFFAQNLIVNGDFESGNTDFSTDYTYFINSNNTQGIYGVVTNPQTWYPSAFDPCIDHTTGTGFMMVADGFTSVNRKVWEQTVAVVPGKSYLFSYFLQTINNNNPAQIEIRINGVSLGANTTAPVVPCSPWVQTSYKWTASSASAIITIYDRVITSTGNDFALDDLSLIACPNSPPTVSTPVYLCQNSPGIPLTVIPDAGSTLIWYGTNAVGGTGSATPPTPLTTVVGSTTYYVSQTDGICESTRSPIVVNVVADNGATILNFRCDPSQIPTYSLDYTPPATINNSVNFDWSNNPLISNTYNFSYSIQGGPPITGTTGTSHWLIPNMLPGQSASLTLTSATHPCVPAQTLTCSVPCGTTTTPTFIPIPSFCTGTTAPVLPATSFEGISGTWSPAIISNTTSGNYVFTPDPILFPCALTQTLPVTVTPLVTPTFSAIPVMVCQGAIPPVLPLISSNATPILGTWSPATVDTSTLGTTVYSFTPNPGQCTSAVPTTVSIRIDPALTPTFTPVAAICSGDALVPLPTTSTNGISGNWSPALNNMATTLYTFTPTAGQCATTANITIIVNPIVTPTFTPVAAIYSSGALAPLPTISTNGITGTWSPALNNMATTLYTFTPAAGQCAATTTLTISVNQIITPIFAVVPAICSGDALVPLPTISTNGISGTWSPALNNTATTLYTFTPTAGLCATTTTLTINVNPIVTPNFAAIPDICLGTTAPALATTSPNGISGTWSPSTVSNVANGSYTFTPAVGQCATTQTLNVMITPRVVTNFAVIPAICEGSTVPILGTTSPNGVSGSWSPATISNTASGNYLFTPNPTECATTQTLSVVVNPLVNPDFVDLFICSGSTPPNLNATSPNGITGTWLPSSIVNTTSGAYVFTPDVSQCATTTTINVTVYPSNTLVAVDWTVTNAFTENQIVAVTATGAGNYEYQMDFGPFQSSPIFENVASGVHSITVIDVNGCSTPITDNNVLVIGYPKFFTPNGDNYNDTWNIVGLKDQLNSRIYIFDRFGKLLKDISPNGNGWDGTYIGQVMPATDYWFTVEYTEGGIVKKFKSHFSLKR